MHPFIGISFLRLCVSGRDADRRADGGGLRGGFRRRRAEARTRRALSGLTAHLRRDIGFEV